MAGVSQVCYQQSLPTPSPFTNSLASTGWSSQLALLRLSNLVLRSSAFIFSAVAALCLSAPMLDKRKHETSSASLTHHPEFRYAFCVALFTALYSATQLLKGICDVAFKGLLISDVLWDYITFFLDQLVGYLLVSSSSVCVPEIERIRGSNSLLKKTTIASVIMSFAAFLVVVASGLLSGYRLCKRIIW